MRYAIVYLRPDGWWVAGTGARSRDEATQDAEAHDWRGSVWKVVPSERGFRGGSIVPLRCQESVDLA